MSIGLPGRAGSAGRTAPIDTATLVDELGALLPEWLARQPWFDVVASEVVSVRPAHFEALCRSWPMLCWAPVDVELADGAVATFQLLLGADPQRPTDIDDQFILGEVSAPSGSVWIFDALGDPRTALDFVRHVAPRLAVSKVGVVDRRATTTSVVADRRWVVKLFRRLEEGANPDVEIPAAVGEAGFDKIDAPVEVWRRGGYDLAVVRPFHAHAVDGSTLASASLRELFDSRRAPREASADFAPHAHAIGVAAAELHVALSRAFGSIPAEPLRLVESLVEHLRRIAPAGLPTDRIEATYRRLLDADDLGSFVRIHGDLHLGRVLSTRRHWLLVDFEGEPSRPLSDRRERSSPLRDVAGMIRSLHYAAELALDELDDPEDRELRVLADAWEHRCVDHLISGYASVDEAHRLLPRHRPSRDALLMLFELDRAVYEVAHEAVHRPERIDIPARAVRRLLGPGVAERW